MKAQVTMTAVDGASKKATYKTLKSVIKFVDTWTGQAYVEGQTHYVANDGISVVDVEWIEPLEVKDETDTPAEVKDETDTPAEVKEQAPIKIKCTECNHGWEVDGKFTNVRCPECKAWNNVRLSPDRERYIRGLDKTASGHDTYDIGDYTADILRGLDVAEVCDKAGTQIAEWLFIHGTGIFSKAMKREFKALDRGESNRNSKVISEYFLSKYHMRNNGMVRMNVGNVLRAMAKRINEMPEDDKVTTKFEEDLPMNEDSTMMGDDE